MFKHHQRFAHNDFKLPIFRCKLWHIKPEYEHFLRDGDTTAHKIPESKPSSGGAVKSKADGKSESSKVKQPKTPVSASKPASAATSVAKRRRNEDDDVDADPPTNEVVLATTPSAKEPKKYKHAFGFFVKVKRPDVEAELGSAVSLHSRHRCLL